MKAKEVPISASDGRTLMPIRRSGSPQRGPETTAEEILEYIKPFKIRNDIMRLTGGVVNRGSTDGDIEIYIEKLEWEDLLRIMMFRLYRGLPRELAERIHFLDDHTGGCFTPHISLGDLLFVPSEEFVRVAMANAGSLRAASKEIIKQCEQSKREDRIKADRMFYLLKPWRGAYEEQKQTIENFVEIFTEDQFPRLTSKKFDGNTFAIFKKGDQVRIYSDDGLLNENLGNVAERIKKLGNSSLVLEAEIGLWRNGVHYPREAARAVMAGARPEWLDDLIINIFEVLYWNGRDIHNLDALDRFAFAQQLKYDQSTEGIPEHGKLLNLIPQHMTKNKEELKRQTERLSALPASEGVVTKRGRWPLQREAKVDWSAKYHKAGWITAVVIERIPTKVETIFNYLYGLPYPGEKLKPSEEKTVGGEKLAVVGKTFNTTFKLFPGDRIEIEFETLNFTENLDEGTFEISCWVPELLRKVPFQPSTIKKAIGIAKANGVYQPKWIQGGETIYDEQLIKRKVKVEVEELELEHFRKKGVDSDMARPEKRYRELWADLRYLGNSAWPRLKAGKTWGDWASEDVKAYFAQIIDVLRSIYFPIIPPEPGDEKWETTWWQLYKAARALMKSKPPKRNLVGEWDRRRAKILESGGNLSATSGEDPSPPTPAPAIIKPTLFVESFQGGDPFMEYPEHGQRKRIMRHLHARGASVHFDARRQLTENYLVGWTENIQIEDAIREPILSMREAKRICAGYSIQDGNHYLKPLVAAGHTGAELDGPGGHILLETKALEPLEWIDFEGVVPPGSVGSTAEFPGVFYIIDKGYTEWGCMKSYYKEYFDSGGKIFNGIYVCRLLKNIWGPELTGTAKMVWMGWYSAETVPYVVRERAVSKHWYPPEGQSALPKVVRDHVPKQLRYWERTGAKAHKLRDELVKEQIFTKETLGFSKKNELVWKGE